MKLSRPLRLTDYTYKPTKSTRTKEDKIIYLFTCLLNSSKTNYKARAKKGKQNQTKTKDKAKQLI
jgi:hypothetical protein